MKRFVLLFVLCSSIQLIAQEYHPEEAYYGSAFWEPDSLGNHRIIVRINEKTDIARAVLPWRRRDSEPEKKGMIIVDAKSITFTGKISIPNAVRFYSNRRLFPENITFTTCLTTLPGDLIPG